MTSSLSCYVYHNIESAQVCQTMDVERFSGMVLSEKVSCVLSDKKAKVIFPNDNILKEHIMPQALTAKWEIDLTI